MESHIRKSSVKRKSDIRDYLKGENEASPSVKRVGSTGASTLKNHPTRNTLPSSEKSTDEEREFTVNLAGDGKDHVVKGSLHDSVLSALKATKDICTHMEKSKGKEIYLIGKKGIEGCINLGMPLKYMPDGSHCVMKCYKVQQLEDSAGLGYRQHENREEECILFFIDPKPTQNNKLIRCSQLLKEYCKLCVCAPKGETIKDALCSDGRFTPELKEKDWRLMEGSKAIANTLSVNNLSDKTFYVEMTKSAKSGGHANSQQIPQVPHGRQLQTCHYFKIDLLSFYPGLKDQKEIMDNFFAKTKEAQEHKREVLKVCRANYSKEISNAITVKMLKKQATLSQSVGYIKWGISRKEGEATCFVLCNSYILTCHHVVRSIVGEGIEEKEWASKISKAAHVTFSYEGDHPKDEDFFSLEEWFEIYDVVLDFAILKLKENGNKSRLPAGLVKLCFPPPFDGLTYIIGHPGGETKSLDACSVVTVCKRQKESLDRWQQGNEAEHSNTNCGYDPKSCIHMLNPGVFSDVCNNPDVLTYDTSFFWGSSGSPVFDRDGQLVAMHAAGYVYGNNSKQRSIIEFGYLMTSILSVIEKKDKSWYDSEIGPFRQASYATEEATVCVEPMDVD
ncbi:serine protease FAM111A [Podarcis raffonei]|uniref:serine protease FAM111A n=1 Tax=Podarcis raffonei TaxID=65483 RepID=UPI0023293495|nr:serine protease FAM111A [Podarcis raffonei]XP_053253886.1 serine protease FAM111A [Podarcis raffonei]